MAQPTSLTLIESDQEFRDFRDTLQDARDEATTARDDAEQAVVDISQLAAVDGTVSVQSSLPSAGNHGGEFWYVVQQGVYFKSDGSSWTKEYDPSEQWVTNVNAISDLRTLSADNQSAAHVRTPTGKTGLFVPMPSDPFGRGDDGATAVENNSGDWWVRVEHTTQNAVLPEWFGAAGDGVADDTAPMQSAINAATERGKKLALAPEKTYRTDLLTIDGSLYLDGQGGELDAIQNAALALSADVERLILDNVGFKKTNRSTGTEGYHAFLDYAEDGDQNLNSLANPGVGGTLTTFTADVLKIKGCRFDTLKVSLTGTGTHTIQGNTWTQADQNTQLAPYYFTVQTVNGGTDHPGGIIENNTFEVYPPDGDNEDIVKISRDNVGTRFVKNRLVNNNTNSEAQLDVFTGGGRALIQGNEFIGVQLHRKQWGPSGGSVDFSFDRIVDNYFELRNGDAETRCIYYIGSLTIIRGNTFNIEQTGNNMYGVFLDAAGANYDDFNSTYTKAVIISGNICYARNVSSGGLAQVDHSNEGGGFAVSGNLQVGGTRLLNGAGKDTTFMGNVLLDSGNLSDFALNAPNGGMAMGNVSDTTDTIANVKTTNNQVGQRFEDVDEGGSTTAVDLDTIGSDLIRFLGGDTITNFENGVQGQTLTLFGAGSGATIEHNSNIKLNNGSNFSMGGNDTLTLRLANGKWLEVSRQTQ